MRLSVKICEPTFYNLKAGIKKGAGSPFKKSIQIKNLPVRLALRRCSNFVNGEIRPFVFFFLIEAQAENCLHQTVDRKAADKRDHNGQGCHDQLGHESDPAGAPQCLAAENACVEGRKRISRWVVIAPAECDFTCAKFKSNDMHSVAAVRFESAVPVKE